MFDRFEHPFNDDDNPSGGGGSGGGSSSGLGELEAEEPIEPDEPEA